MDVGIVDIEENSCQEDEEGEVTGARGMHAKRVDEGTMRVMGARARGTDMEALQPSAKRGGVRSRGGLSMMDQARRVGSMTRVKGKEVAAAAVS